MAFEYDDHDYLFEQLRAHHRRDLATFVPDGGERVGRTERLFWADVIARFRRGEWADAVTAIERRFMAMSTSRPVDDNAYVFAWGQE